MRRNPHIVGRIRWAALALAATFAGVLFVATSGAQAVVVNDGGVTAGVAMVPGTRSDLPGGTIALPGGSCNDPWLTSDLIYQPNTNPLCYRGGSVIHANETFALTWDPTHAYWSGTRGYVEQFLRDVADASGSLNDPYALTTQYQDSTGRASDNSKYGGGCIDFGNPNNATNTTCLFGNSVQTGPGNNYPASGCPVTGGSYVDSSAPDGNSPNGLCLTDSQLQGEIASVVSQTGLLPRTQPNYTPMVVMLLPAGVETCLDSAGNVCSANSSASAKFCSYHSQVNVGGTEVSYVVQPWTVETECDEPDVDPIPNPVPVDQLGKLAGERLVSPISQSEMAAITDPALNGWTAADGSEINDDNGCVPEPSHLDATSVGNGSYFLQREWDNGAAIAFDPNTYFGCAPNVLLNPNFVVPSAVDPGDAVVFDGSTSASTLIVPDGEYVWDFGDGTGAVGPSVVHSYAKGGTFTVTLTVTDRGGNKRTLTQTITVLGANGLPVPPSNPPTTKPTNTGSSGPLQVRMQLLPQALRGVIRSGIKVQVVSNGPANGIATVYVSRAMAKRAKIKAGQGKVVTIGRGTLSQIKVGTVVLHLHLSRATARKLKHVKHAVLNVRLSLVGVGGSHLVTVAAGRY